jgi:serine/threonine protein kinase
VLEAVDHSDFRVEFPRFGISDIRYYVCELLKALSFCHEQGVMHRDIRPHNVVIDPQSKQVKQPSRTMQIVADGKLTLLDACSWLGIRKILASEYRA